MSTPMLMTKILTPDTRYQAWELESAAHRQPMRSALARELVPTREEPKPMRPAYALPSVGLADFERVIARAKGRP